MTRRSVVFALLAGVIDGVLAVAWGYAWRVPFMLTMLGTAMVSWRWGWITAVLSAIVASGVEAILIDPARLVFLPVRLVAVLIMNGGIKYGWTKGRKLALLSLAQGVAVGLSAALI
ncbi:MAG: hypothetical protein GY803_29160 [Chloroflexi bacterium]|nr:hypothetical protein [Chloroflexota bacterium]